MSGRVRQIVTFVLAVAAGGGTTATAPAAWAGSSIARASVGPGGVQSNGFSSEPSLSGTGRFVAFESTASNLVPNDRNGELDVFVRDRQAGTTRRVSIGAGGSEGDLASFSPSISRDGRFVAFGSNATNLVPNDTNGEADVLVRDLQAGTTRRVSVATGGGQGNGPSVVPSISAGGRFVVFYSAASNLVPNDTNGEGDVFIHDLETGTTRRVSVGPGEVQGNGLSGDPTVSADGRFVAFVSDATNLVPNDTNGAADVFVRDLLRGRTRRVSTGPGGVQASGSNAAISQDGRFVVFDSSAANLVPNDTNRHNDIFIRNLETGAIQRASVGSGGEQANGSSNIPAISGDGRFVTFHSDASNLVPNDTNAGQDGETDVFVRDLQAGTTRRVNVARSGAQAETSFSLASTISADGRVVAFTSEASNLVPRDTNGQQDVFVRTR